MSFRNTVWSLVIILTSLSNVARVSVGELFIGSRTMQSSTDIAITILVDDSSDEVTFTFTGPTNRWFAIGFGSDTMSSTYAIYHTTSNVGLERRLGNGAKGSLLSSSVNVTNDTTINGVRYVTVARDTVGVGSNYYSFDTIGNGTVLDCIWAYGSSGSFNSHSSRGDKTVTFEAYNPTSYVFIHNYNSTTLYIVLFIFKLNLKNKNWLIAHIDNLLHCYR